MTLPRGRTVWSGLLSFSLCISIVAHAQAPSPPGAADEMELFSLETKVSKMVQSATLKEQEIATVPSVISVMTADEFRSLGLRTLRDVLQLFPGVTVLDNQFGEIKVAIRGIANPNN